MNNLFGMGIYISLKDTASKGLNMLCNTFRHTENKAKSMTENVSRSFSVLQNLSINGAIMNQFGDGIERIGKNGVNSLKGLGSQIINTGADFENSRVTLEALYKSASVAKEKMTWAMNLAAKTPFEINDIKSAIIGFKSIGIESDKTMGKVNGQAKTFLEYMGDLASLRPDQGMSGVLTSVRNLMSGDKMSFKRRLDVDPEQILGRKLGDTQEQKMKDLVELSQKMAKDLMTKQQGTWGHMISNLKDQFTRFFLGIADGGAFDKAKGTLEKISKAIDTIDDEKMKKLGVNIAGAFNIIWKPIDFVVTKLIDFGKVLERLTRDNPLVSKIIIGFMGISSAVLVTTGIFFKLAGGMMMAIGTFGTFLLVLTQVGGMSTVITGIKATLAGLFSSLIPWAVTLGIFYLAFRSNFLGIRDILQNFVNNTHTAFTYSAKISSMSAKDMGKSMNDLYQRFNKGDLFAGLTLGIVKLRMLWIGLADAWNDNELSDENFKKARVAGVLPLIETIIKAKVRFQEFFKGFSNGWKEANTSIKLFVGGIIQQIGKFITYIKKLATNLGILKPKAEKTKKAMKDLSKGVNIQRWQKIGDFVGRLVAVLGGLFVLKRFTPILTKIFRVVKFIIGFIVAHPLIALVVGLIAGVTMLYKKSASFRNLVKGIFNVIKGVVMGVGALIIGLIGVVGGVIYTLIGIIGGIVTAVVSVGATFLTVFMGIITIVATVGRVIWTTIQMAFAIVKAIILTSVAIITGNFDMLGAVWSGLCSRIGELANTCISKVKGYWTSFKDHVNGIWEGIKSTASGFFNWIAEKFAWMSKIVDGAKNLMNKAGNAVEKGTKQGTKGNQKHGKMVGMATGGYVKTAGIAMLHPNEVVVNDDTTQKLRSFLSQQKKGKGKFNSIKSTNQHSNVDQSVNIEKGAIVIQAKNIDGDNIDGIIDKIEHKLKRRKELKNMLNYQPS